MLFTVNDSNNDAFAERVRKKIHRKYSEEWKRNQ